MNILMLTNTYEPFVGGVPRSVGAFTRELRQRGHRVVVVAPAMEGVPDREEDVIRIPALQHFNGSDFAVVLPIPGYLHSRLGSFKPDIVVCTHFLPSEIMSWLKAKKQIACPQAIVVTDFDVHAFWLCRYYEQYFVALEETRVHMEKLGVEKGKVSVTGSGAGLSAFTGNTLLGVLSTAGTLSVDAGNQLTTSDYNGFYHAVRAAHIYAQGEKTLAQWRSYSGKDAHSTERIAGVLALAQVFYNDTSVPTAILLDRPYDDLNGNRVGPAVALGPYSCVILVPDGPPIQYLRLFLPLAQRIEWTEVHTSPAGDTRFPDIDRGQWSETFRERHAVEGRVPAFDFVTLHRKPSAK